MLRTLPLSLSLSHMYRGCMSPSVLIWMFRVMCPTVRHETGRFEISFARKLLVVSTGVPSNGLMEVVRGRGNTWRRELGRRLHTIFHEPSRGRSFQRVCLCLPIISSVSTRPTSPRCSSIAWEILGPARQLVVSYQTFCEFVHEEVGGHLHKTPDVVAVSVQGVRAVHQSSPSWGSYRDSSSS